MTDPEARCRIQKPKEKSKFNFWVEQAIFIKKEIKLEKARKFWKRNHGAMEVNIDNFDNYDFVRAGQDYMDKITKFKCNICEIIFLMKKTLRYHNNSNHPCNCMED